MRILLLTTHLNAGGITSYLSTISKGLIRRGHEVWIASSGGQLVADFEQIGVKHVLINIKTKSELNLKIYFAAGQLARLIKDHNIDLVHSQTRITQVMGECLNQWAQIPHVSTCHGFFKVKLGRKLFPCWGQRVLAISEPVQQHLIKDFGYPPEKVALIHSGVDLESFQATTDSIRQKRKVELKIGADPVIGVIARLSDVKGLDVLISAMPEVIQKITNARLLIIGEGKEEAALKQLTASLKLDDHVRFFPVVNRTPEMLFLFDCFVMPSLQEGLGLSIMEAQACALPVIASRVGGIPSLITHGKTGWLVEPRNPKELAQKIIYVLEHRVEAETVGIAAREFIQNNFSSNEMVEQTLAVYRQTVGEKKV